VVDILKSFYLADWYVDTATNRLCRADIEVKLESKVMAVLHYLAQHKGELVTREALEQAIWSNSVVGYDALTSCIAKLRKVLEDDPRQPRYIETISKKGYRLIGEISSTAPKAKTSAVPTTDGFAWRTLGWGTGASLLLLGLILITVLYLLVINGDKALETQARNLPSIVVLPFANLSDESEHDYFSDGITVDITTALSKLSGLFVISPSSASGYRETPVNIKQVAGSLGVRYVVEGSVRRTGDRLRVNIHLVDANSDIYLWSEKYDRELQNVFAVQDDITTNIINALSVKLTEEEKRRTARRYTSSIASYDDFLRGQALYINHTERDNHQARDYYQQAIDRDEAFARAYSSLALTYVAEHRYGWSQSSPLQLDRALTLAEKGVALDRELPQSYWVLGYVHLFRREYREAAAAANRAIELNPNFADSYITLAVCKMYFGAAEESLHLVRKAMLLNPKYPAAYVSVLGQIYFFMGKYELAESALREAVARNMHLRTPHVFLIVALSKLNQLDEANWAAEQFKTIAPDFNHNKVAGMLPLQDTDIVEDMKKHLQRVGL